MKKPVVVILLIVILLAALGGGWWNEGPLADASRPGSGAVIERPGLAPVR